MKMIKATDLSKIMGQKSWFISCHHYKKDPFGAKILGGILYYNVEYAKCIAESYKLYLKSSIEEIKQKIDDYSP